ncbi:hypothetical protein FRX31_016681, partial [Thalictrum thalictroides]
MGYYASVQIDTDLSKRIPDKILVEVEDKNVEFWQEVQVGRLPKICNNCKIVGHSVSEYRHLQHDPEKGGKGKEIVKETFNSKLLQPVNMDVMSKSKKKRWRRKNNILQARKSTSDAAQNDLEASGSGAGEGSTVALVVVEEGPVLKEAAIEVLLENEKRVVEPGVDTVLVNANVVVTLVSNKFGCLETTEHKDFDQT